MVGFRLASAAFLVIALAACSAQSRGPDFDLITCEQFNALSSESRGLVTYDEGRVEVYSDDGAESMKDSDYFAIVCAEESAANTTIREIHAGIASPPCADFIARPDTVQEAWAAVALDAIDAPSGRAVLLHVCSADPTLTLDLASASASGIEIYQPVAFEWLMGLDSEWAQMTWTSTTQLGYVTTAVLLVGAPLSPEESAHPFDNATKAATACAFDPTTDIAIPIGVVLRNDTAQPGSVAARFALRATREDIVTSAELSLYDSCDPVVGGGVITGSQTGEAIDPGQLVSVAGFVIVHDFFSPRFPNGANDELASYVFESRDVNSPDDPIVETTPALVALG